MPAMANRSMSARVLAALVALAVLLSGQLVLSGCEVDRETQADGDESLEITLDGEALDNAERNLEAAGDKIREGAEKAGDAIEDAASETAETVDENVDVGENARDGDG